MTEAEKAYKAAQALIAKAKANGWDELFFDTEEFRELEELPPEIANLRPLITLDCDNTALRSLHTLIPIAKDLESLWLSWHPDVDFGVLSLFENIKYLVLNDTNIVNLDCLSGLSNLELLELSRTRVRDLDALSGLKNLFDLKLNGTLVEDISPLSDQNLLETLELDNCPVRDLFPLLSLLGRPKVDEQLVVLFSNTPASLENPRILEISEIEDYSERASALYEYLKSAVPSSQNLPIEAFLRGPVLSEALADVEKQTEQFHATSLTDEPAKELDKRHAELVSALTFICTRLGAVDVQNRLGKDVRQNFKDYGSFVVQEPINGRILWFLANGVRSVLSDQYSSDAIDGFDQSQLSGFLSESDALVQEYYPDAMQGVRFETETDPSVLSAEFPAKLQSAKELVEAVDANGVFAPSVSTTLEMLIRRAEGASRGYATAATEEEREASGKELQRIAVQSTGFVGRINVRLTQWLKSVADDPKVQGVGAIGGAAGAGTLLWQGATWVVQNLTPIFEAMWKMIGNLPLPF